MPSILCVDDDMFFRKVIEKILSGNGYEITLAQSGEEALKILQTQSFDLMISDVNMTPMNGLELLEKAHEAYAGMGVIMLTGHDSVRIAIEAMEKGAFDFIVKPFQVNELNSVVQRSLECGKVSPESKPLQAQIGLLGDFVAESDAMREVYSKIRRIAPANVAVLLYGESGSGQEHIARTLHHYSPRKDEPFMAIDCAALSAPQLDEELFGRLREKGDTKATASARAGLFKGAHKGTLFLDNMDAMPLDMQSKFLNLIQTKEIFEEDWERTIEIDVRLIVASSKKLDTLVEQGGFQENLYCQLSALRIDIPPVRDRPEDIPLLIEQALRRNLEPDVDPPTLDLRAMEILCGYAWPGNISMLETVIQNLLAFAQNNVITVEMLPTGIVEAFEEKLSPEDGGDDRGEEFKGQAFKAFISSKQEQLLRQSTQVLKGK